MQANQNKSKIFFDISYLVIYIGHITRYSGIQRVTTSIIAKYFDLYRDESIYISWIDHITKEYVCAPVSEIGRDVFLDVDRLKSLFYDESGVDAPGYPLAKYASRPVSHWYHRRRLDLNLLIGRKKAFARYGIMPGEWRETRKSARAKMSKRNRTRKGIPFRSIASAGDRLLALDTAWEDRNTEIFRDADRQGIRVYVMVYDLIPILHPGWTFEDSPRIFRKWIGGLEEYAHQIMTISDYTRKELESYLGKTNLRRTIRPVPLVQEFTAAWPDTKDGDFDEVFFDISRCSNDVRWISGTRYVLCVGTFEGRKNIWRIASAWKMLIDRGLGDRLPKLVFAGRSGWLRDDFENLLKGTGNVYGWVHLVEAPTDTELAVLYRHCLFFVFASLHEGWGLPVGEGLSYGKTGVVSNVTSLPEVGGDFVEYCDPESIESIANAAMRLVSEPARRQELETRIRNAKLRSWEDVCRDLAEILKE